MKQQNPLWGPVKYQERPEAFSQPLQCGILSKVLSYRTSGLFLKIRLSPHFTEKENLTSQRRGIPTATQTLKLDPRFPESRTNTLIPKYFCEFVMGYQYARDTQKTLLHKHTSEQTWTRTNQRVFPCPSSSRPPAISSSHVIFPFWDFSIFCL